MAWTPANAQEAVEALYIGYFGRAGEPGGVSYWIDQINAAPNLQTGFALAAAAFSVQQEAKNEYAFLAAPNLASPVAFITSLYNNLLERAPDAEGLAYWTGQATAAQGNPFAIGLLVAQFISGAQNANGFNDIDTIQNKVDAAEYFTSALANANISGTDADGQVLPAVQAAGKSIIGEVTSDDATVTAANEASDNFAAGGGAGVGVEINVAAGQSVSLNQADLGLRSTDGDDTITGVLTEGQSIAAAGGNDTIDVELQNNGTAVATILGGAGNDTIIVDTVAGTNEFAIDGGTGTNSAEITLSGSLDDDNSISNVQDVTIISAGNYSIDATEMTGITAMTFEGAGDITVNELVGTADFTLTGAGDISINYATGDEAAEVSVTFDGSTGGYFYTGSDETETINLEIAENSTSTGLYSYAQNINVTGEGEWTGQVGLYNSNDLVTFDASALNEDTVIGFSTNYEATILQGDARDFTSISFYNEYNVSIDQGGGEDTLTVGDASNLSLTAGGDLDTWAQIVGAEADETIVFNFVGALTEETIAPATLVGVADIEAALDIVAAGTDAINDFTVFEFQGSTYAYFASTATGTVTDGDGLVQLVNTVGTSYVLAGGDLTITI